MRCTWIFCLYAYKHYFFAIVTPEMDPALAISLDCKNSSAECVGNEIQYTFVCSVVGKSLQWQSELFDKDLVFGPLSILGRLPVLPEHSWSWYTTIIMTHVPK